MGHCHPHGLTYEEEAKYPENVESEYKPTTYVAPIYSAPAHKSPAFTARPAYIVLVVYHCISVCRAAAYVAPTPVAHVTPAYEARTNIAYVSSTNAAKLLLRPTLPRLTLPQKPLLLPGVRIPPTGLEQS